MLTAALLAATTFQVFIGWRAGDLAEKALADVRAGNLAMARHTGIGAVETVGDADIAHAIKFYRIEVVE